MAREALTQSRRETRLIDHLKRILAKGENRGRVISVSEISRELGCSRNTFYSHIGTIMLAQEWLAANQDAALDAKAHYKAMLENELASHEGDIAVVHKGERHGHPVKHFVEKKVVTEEVKRMAHDIRRVPEIKVVKTVVGTEVVEVTEKEKTIDRLREEFVMAPVGSLPNIHTQMQDLGLLDADGKPTGEITEAEVRQIAIQEMWKNQRADYLHQAFDVIQEEVKMVSLMRSLKAQEMLDNTMRVHNRLYLRYVQTGEAKSLDGQRTINPPDPALLPAFAEAMRRMTDTGGNINILLNQNNHFQGGSGRNPSIPPHTLKYIQKLQEMSPDDIQKENRRLETEIQLLRQGKSNVTWEEIQAQNDANT